MSRLTLALGAMLVAACLASAAQPNPNFFMANYFANWAQYRGTFAYTPTAMQPVMDKYSYVIYAFAWINGGCNGCSGPTVYDQMGQCKYSNGTCTTYSNGTRLSPQCPGQATDCTGDGNFTLLAPEPDDGQFMQQIVQMKAAGQKVILSVGGWNFPSSIYSQMVANANTRSFFLNSLKTYLTKYNLDGVDFDWEFYGSPPRYDHIKLTNTSFHNFYDVGGTLPADADNLLLLCQDARKVLGDDAIITIASQADPHKMQDVDIEAISKVIDYWHLMNYDYSVSDLPAMCGDAPCFANFTAPNQPLYAPKAGQIPAHFPPFASATWSVNDTVTSYLARGAPASKLVVGLALYGHAWYIPGEQNWQRFGVPAKISGKCDGPFQPTFGAWAGRRARLCGTLIYSEIMSLINPNDTSQNFFDQSTQSDIGYITSKDGSHAGEDLSGSTPAWVSWNSIKSMKIITKYAMDKGLGGVFLFDGSMDIFADGSYPVTNAIHDLISGGGGGGGHDCNPASCNVCQACCKSYLKDKADCDACVAQEC